LVPTTSSGTIPSGWTKPENSPGTGTSRISPRQRRGDGRGVRATAARPVATLVAINIGDADQTVPFWFPLGGDYVEELHGGALNLNLGCLI
jgi:hypothetical protein